MVMTLFSIYQVISGFGYEELRKVSERQKVATISREQEWSTPLSFIAFYYSPSRFSLSQFLTVFPFQCCFQYVWC